MRVMTAHQALDVQREVRFPQIVGGDVHRDIERVAVLQQLPSQCQ